MNWLDNITLVGVPRRRGTLQLAIYAMHLGTGCTIICRQIKVCTIKKYILDVSHFLQLFDVHSFDFCYDNSGESKFSPVLQKVYDELERWENVPNRREPFTLEMLEDYRAEVIREKYHEDSLHAAMLDWFEIGLFAGLRKSEFAQDAGCYNTDYPKMNFRHETQAFCLGDVYFQSSTRRRYTAVQALTAPPSEVMVKCWIVFRTQKNGSNGEQRLFSKNRKVGGKCFVKAMMRVLRRFVRLMGANDFTTPLAIYSPGPGVTPRLITSTEIESIMRKVASRLYNLDPVKDQKDLQRWSTHSLRVGACVILHVMGFSEAQIKWLLRWRSNAFMVYLRNLVPLAEKQCAAFDEAVGMPHFL
jgi:hypothetical protein